MLDFQKFPSYSFQGQSTSFKLEKDSSWEMEKPACVCKPLIIIHPLILKY